MAKNEYETVALVKEVFENGQCFFIGVGKRGTEHKVAACDHRHRRNAILVAAMEAEARDTDGFVTCSALTVHVTGLQDVYAVPMTVETDK